MTARIAARSDSVAKGHPQAGAPPSLKLKVGVDDTTGSAAGVWIIVFPHLETRWATRPVNMME